MPMIEVVERHWGPELPDIELPDEDGEPLESHWHCLQINLLGDLLYQHWRGRIDFFAGGNMFVYYSLQQVRTRSYKGPDFFVTLGVDGTRPRRSWIVWQERGRHGTSHLQAHWHAGGPARYPGTGGRFDPGGAEYRDPARLLSAS